VAAFTEGIKKNTLLDNRTRIYIRFLLLTNFSLRFLDIFEKVIVTGHMLEFSRRNVIPILKDISLPKRRCDGHNRKNKIYLGS